MKQKQLKRLSTKQLVAQLKSESHFGQDKTAEIYKELKEKLRGGRMFRPLSIAYSHFNHGNGNSKLIKECDNLIKLL